MSNLMKGRPDTIVFGVMVGVITFLATCLHGIVLPPETCTTQNVRLSPKEGRKKCVVQSTAKSRSSRF